MDGSNPVDHESRISKLARKLGIRVVGMHGDAPVVQYPSGEQQIINKPEETPKTEPVPLNSSVVGETERTEVIQYPSGAQTVRAK